MAKGVTYERVHIDIGLYMCVHIIQRYDDAMKEKGGEGRERKERDMYIYKIYRVGPLLSAGVVSMRQHALLLYARAYYYLSVHAHITHTCARIRARMRMHMHTTHSSAHAQTRMDPGTYGPTTHAHTHPRMNTHACMRTHTRYARMQAHACMHPHNAPACIRTRTREHTCTCAHTRANTSPHILAAR